MNSPRQATTPQRPRRPRLISAAALVVAMLVAGAGGAVWLRPDGSTVRVNGESRRASPPDGSAKPHSRSSETQPSALVSSSAPGTTAGPSTSTSSSVPGPAALAAVRGKTIAIDPGHDGGNARAPRAINQIVDYGGGMRKTCDTAGTAASDGYTESRFNLDVALRLEAILATAGARVVLTRSNDTGVGPCVPERAAIGNRAGADVAISIHADGNLSASARGFHVIAPRLISGLTDAIYQPSKRLSLDVRAAFDSTGMPRSNYIGVNGLIERDDLGGLRLSKIPKVFIECGNMRNPMDASKLENPTWRQLAAQQLAVGLAVFVSGR